MSSVVLTATLLTGLWLALANPAAAQDPPPESVPAPSPAPNVRDVAVRRAERMTAREAEAVPDGPSGRAPLSATDRASRRESQTADGVVSRRESGNIDDGAQRRGAVRRPPAGGRPAGDSGSTRDRAIPRPSAPPRQPLPRGRVVVYPNAYRYYNAYYDPWGYGAFGLGYFYYSPWNWNSGYYGPGYGYGPGGPRYGAYGYDTGSVKLKVSPRDAEVYVDGYFAGYVDDFDGVFQALRLDSGGYRIEVRKPGFETLQFDVRVQPERSMTFRGELKPIP